MELNDTQKVLLTLIANSLWGRCDVVIEVNWEQVEQLAKTQGILPLLYRGAIKCKNVIPIERIQIWRGAMYAAVLRNDHMNEAQSEILGWLSAQDIRATVLKGTSVARYYVPSDMRSLGDIDLLIAHDDLVKASSIMAEHGYVLRGQQHDFHVSFLRDDVTVEVHHKASVVPSGKGGQEAEKIMNQFLDESVPVRSYSTQFLTLSEKHQALMLLMHMERHIIEGGIGLRQLCDWAVFLSVEKETSLMEEIVRMFRECGLMTFAQVVTKACVRYLGLQGVSVAWCMEADDALVDALIEDVFRSGNMGRADQENDSSLFIGRTMLGDKEQSAIKGLLRNLNRLSNKHFPVTCRYKWLLPIFWIYIPLRYIIRSLFGLRKKRNVFRVLKQSGKRFELHKNLHLYEVN